MKKSSLSKRPSSTVFLFDPDRMVLGDIVLERGTNAGSALIAAVTGGAFSHALIWVGGDFIEAMPDGVRSLSFARVPVIEPSNWRLLRAKPENLEIAKNAADQARSMVFRGYDTEGAIRTVFGPRKEPVPTARFCSQLVAEAYLRAGLELLPGSRPEMIHPNMLAQTITHVQTDLPLVDSRKIVDSEYPAELLDRSVGYLQSGMRREFEVEQALFGSVQSLLVGLQLPAGYDRPPPGGVSDVLDLLPHLLPEQARAIADALLQSMIREGYLFLLVEPMADIWRRVKPETYWQSQIPAWRQTQSRHLQNAEACAFRNATMDHPLWQHLQAMYLRNANAFEGLISKASSN